MFIKKEDGIWRNADGKEIQKDINYYGVKLNPDSIVPGTTMHIKTKYNSIVKVEKKNERKIKLTPFHNENKDKLMFVYIDDSLHPLSESVKKFKNNETGFVDFEALKKANMDYYIEAIDDLTIVGIIPRINEQNFKTIIDFEKEIREIEKEVSLDPLATPHYITAIKVYDDVSLEKLKESLLSTKKIQKNLRIYHTGIYEFTLLSKFQLHNVISGDLIVEFNSQPLLRFKSVEISKIRLKLFEGMEQDVDKEEKNALNGLFYALHSKTDETVEHSLRLGQICDLIGEELLLSSEELSLLRKMAEVHDVGKLAIEGKIINKPGKLTSNEFDIVKKHTILGYEMLEKFNGYNEARLCCLQHHEKWDGTGYPNQLKAEEINPLVRIVTVADSIDAMASLRVYKPAFNFEYIKSEIIRCQGEQFCPQVAKVAIDSMDRIEALYDEEEIHSPQTEAVGG